MTNYKDQIIKFFKSIEYDFDDIDLEIIKSGRNNKVFKVTQNRNTDFLVKFYSIGKKEKQYRLKREVDFLRYLENIDIEKVPKILFISEEQNIGMFNYVQGKKFKHCDLNKERVIECANFFNEINTIKQDLNKSLYEAAESFIEPDIFLKDIDNRIKKLLEFSKGEKEYHLFFKELNNLWKRVRKNALGYEHLKTSRHNLCISPSDFGFHNCIINENNELTFIDFEYSGLDDPVKFICDYFSQPDIPVPLEFFEEFSNEAFNYSQEKSLIINRSRTLLPLFQIKWCCIIMNLFLPEVLERRNFSDPDFNLDKSKKMQLKKANELFSKIKYV